MLHVFFFGFFDFFLILMFFKKMMRITVAVFVMMVAGMSRSTQIKTESPIIGVLTTPLKDSGDCVTLTRNENDSDENDSDEGSCFHNLVRRTFAPFLF